MDTLKTAVLLIEENDSDYRKTSALLKATSPELYTLTRSLTFHDTLTSLLSNSYDIAIVGSNIGKYTGIQLIQTARAQHVITPIIVLSHDESGDEEALQAGAADYLIRKEVTTALLQRSIRYIREHRLTLLALQDAHNSLEKRVLERTSTISKTQHTLAIQALQQTAIAQLGQIALSATTLDDLFSEALAIAVQILNVPYVAVLEAQPVANLLVFRAAIGWPVGLVGTQSIPLTQLSHPGYAFQSGTPIVVDDIQKDTRFSDQYLITQGITSGICISIQGNEASWGVLCVHTAKRRRFTKEETNFLQSFSNVLALAIERNRMEESMRHQASHDQITGIPNRLLLEDRLEVEISRAKRNKSNVGLLFLDLDNFKHINDTFGHTLGDAVLAEVAQRFQESLEDGSTLARFGGDEFIALIPGVPGRSMLEKAARSIFKSLAKPFKLTDQEFTITTSIGIAMFPRDGDTAEILIRNADTALYRAKDHGRNSYQLYLETMNSHSSARLRIGTELRHAVEHQELELWYQPIINIKKNTLIGAEALLRWCHPVLGILLPSEFINIAEETGLITQIGEWAIRKAANDIITWENAGIKPVTISVNLSAQQFGEEDFFEKIKQIVADTQVEPTHLEFEVTETMAMQDIQRTITRLEALREMGFSAAIDDFGTGHSSLNYLKQLPVQKLKIDQSFVRDCVDNTQDAAIVRAIIALAHSLGLVTVAEGVENKDQLAFLLSLNCDTAQGFLFNHPLPLAKFQTLLPRRK